jgi:hypothetical protein
MRRRQPDVAVVMLVGLTEALSGIDVDGRDRVGVVDVLGFATSLSGRAQVGELGHAMAVGAPDGIDGPLENVDEGERVASVERR